MIALLFAVAVAAQTPGAQTPGVQTPPAANASATPATPPADPPPKSAPERLADLRVMYDQTCGNRAYGAYDDLCETLSDQIRKAQREIAMPARPKPVTRPKAAPQPPLVAVPSTKN